MDVDEPMTASLDDLFKVCENSSIHVQLYLLQNDKFVESVRLKVFMGLGFRRAYTDFILTDYKVTVSPALVCQQCHCNLAFMYYASVPTS